MLIHKIKEVNMTSRRKRNDFINFIYDATEDRNLANRFFKKNSAESLYRFFRREKYYDIPLNDCEDILRALRGMRGKGVNDSGKTVNCSTVASTRRY
jgi:hypothetical protein